MRTETTGHRQTAVRLPPPLLGPGSDPLAGECLRF